MWGLIADGNIPTWVAVLGALITIFGGAGGIGAGVNYVRQYLKDRRVEEDEREKKNRDAEDAREEKNRIAEEQREEKKRKAEEERDERHAKDLRERIAYFKERYETADSQNDLKDKYIMAREIEFTEVKAELAHVKIELAEALAEIKRLKGSIS